MDSSETDNRLALLVLRAQAGDVEAINLLMTAIQEPLFGYLVSLVGDSSAAEDALQLTFIQIYRKVKWLREPLLFRIWAFRIASRVAYRVTKKVRKQHERSNNDCLEQIADASMDPIEEPALDGLVAQIPDWLGRLTHRGREAVVLHYLKGFTVPEVAEILGIPPGTVKSRISYALACIRKFTNRLPEKTNEQ